MKKGLNKIFLILLTIIVLIAATFLVLMFSAYLLSYAVAFIEQGNYSGAGIIIFIFLASIITVGFFATLDEEKEVDDYNYLAPPPPKERD